MAEADYLVLLLQLALMLLVAVICGQVMRWFHQPAVLGEMLGGILLGPTIAGLLFPELQMWLFPSSGSVHTAATGIIRVGMLLYLFLIGLEIDLKSLRQYGLSAVAIGLAGTLVPLAAGIAMVYLLPDWWGIKRPEDQLPIALFLGASMANTANPVLARILQELGLIKERLGGIIMSATVIDDLIGWSLAAVVASRYRLATETGVAGSPMLDFSWGIVVGALLLATILVVGRFVIGPLLSRTKDYLPTTAGELPLLVGFVLLAAGLAESLGSHAMLGAFMLGMALASQAERFSPAAKVLTQVALGFFVPLYFVSMGLSANFIADFNWPQVLVVLGVACVSKIGSVFLAARFCGISSSLAGAVACGMNARGAVGIILAGMGLSAGLLDQTTYVSLVVMCLATSLFAGPMMKLLVSPAPQQLKSCDESDSMLAATAAPEQPIA